jgi:glycosyltransferase involved in cell wall biosynthesis
MTILEITAVPFTDGYRGGGESYPWCLSQELANYEDVLTCFCPPPGSSLFNDRIRPIPGAFVDIPPVLRRLNPLPHPGSLRAIIRCLDETEDLEFLHVHNLRTAMSSTWLFLSHLNRVGHRFKVLLTDHNSRWFPFPRLTARWADYYVPVSEESKSILNRYQPRPSYIVPTGVPMSYPGLQLKFRPWNEREFDLIFFGRIAPWKRPDLVLRLARGLMSSLDRPPGVVIAGSVESDGYLRWLRSESARLGLGNRTRFVLDPSTEEAASLIAKTRLHLLLSSHWDVFGHYYPCPELAPITIIEAAACGTPSLCSNLPGVREQVLHGRTGLAVSPDDWPPLLAASRELLTHPERWMTMAQEARQFAIRDRTYHVLAQRLSGFLAHIREGLA